MWEVLRVLLLLCEEMRKKREKHIVLPMLEMGVET
jgi:hypothetical protein